MWSYYGSKRNIINLYPPAGNEKIIEPFAGTARYALRFWRRNVLLVDRYPELIEIWKFLQTCSDIEIERIPHFVQEKQTVNDFSFDSRPAKLLFQFLIGYAVTTPRITVSSQKVRSRPNFINFGLNRIQKDRKKIKHWDIVCDDYRNIKNQQATWFIDPPYQVAGYKYKFNKIDYDELARYSLSRKGQVIVCEGPGASWLPFREFCSHHGARGLTSEFIYHTETAPGTFFYPNQLSLF